MQKLTGRIIGISTPTGHNIAAKPASAKTINNTIIGHMKLPWSTSTSITRLTQSEYDELEHKNANTYYFITD